MDRITISLTDTVTPMLKRLEAVSHDLAPAMHDIATTLAKQVGDQLAKLPVPWARKGKALNPVKQGFTALSAFVTLAGPVDITTPPDTDMALRLVSARIKQAIGASA
jgi:hypothetical protein